MTRLFELTSGNPANVGNSGRLLQPGIMGINMKRTQTLGAALVLATMITGCGSSSGVSTGAALSGEVVGGGAHNPVSGAAITLYAMGSSGYGVGNTSLGTATSDSSGAWTTNYSCPSGNSGVQTYVTAIGGDAGSGTNSAIGLTALAGPCNALSSSSFVMVNELATVAAEWALAQ